MANLSGPRVTDQLGENAKIQQLVLPVAANAVIYAGAQVDLNASGYAVPAATNTTGRAMGRAEQSIDNTGGADGALKIIVRRGAFKWGNSASGDAIDNTKIGLDAYVVDDHTVALTDNSGARHKAGKIIQVDPDGGVFVETTFY